MVPINNVSINTLDKSYNVFSSKEIDKTLVESNQTNEEKTIEENINFNINSLEISDNERINTKTDLETVLKNVKSNIENLSSFDIYTSSLSSKALELLQ